MDSKSKKSDELKQDQIDRLKADVHILEYVDYSSKYGVGYMMSDGVFGVFFNDSTQVSNLATQRAEQK